MMSEKISNWNFEFISAHDLETIGWIPDAIAKSLWKLLEQRRKMAEYNVKIANINGLLNLYGWYEMTDYNPVPEYVEVGKGECIIRIPTDCLVKVRQTTRQSSDMHSEKYIDGMFKRVRRKILTSFFAEDADIPIFASYQDAGKGRLIRLCGNKNQTLVGRAKTG